MNRALPKALLCWSSGKDSAWTLHVLRQLRDVKVVGLLTTINTEYERVAMHAVRVALLEAQAEAAGLPLWTVPIQTGEIVTRDGFVFADLLTA